jgi:hypothetical protein
LHPGVLGPGKQKCSHLQPQQMISTFFSSQTSRQTFWHDWLQPQWAQQSPALAARAALIIMTTAKTPAIIISTGWRPRNTLVDMLDTNSLKVEVESHRDDV